MTESNWPSGRRIPGVTQDTRGYWQSGEDGELRIQHCEDCGVWQHPPSPVCRDCFSPKSISFQPVSGRGHVSSWTLNYQPWFPGQKVPFHAGFIELVEQPGLYIFGGLLGAEEFIDITGREVTTGFHQQGDVWLPVFTLIDEEVTR